MEANPIGGLTIRLPISYNLSYLLVHSILQIPSNRYFFPRNRSTHTIVELPLRILQIDHVPIRPDWHRDSSSLFLTQVRLQGSDSWSQLGNLSSTRIQAPPALVRRTQLPVLMGHHRNGLQEQYGASSTHVHCLPRISIHTFQERAEVSSQAYSSYASHHLFPTHGLLSQCSKVCLADVSNSRGNCIHNHRCSCHLYSLWEFRCSRLVQPMQYVCVIIIRFILHCCTSILLYNCVDSIYIV